MFTNQHVSRIVYETMSDMWIYEQCLLTLNEEMIKIKVVDSDEFNNFYVHDFSTWNQLRF